ncbi:hypothetical protein TNCT_527941 [Trichonephila clavata]|uniref:Uncharacterized protein n=1 Tax=Trichonephila clavata TaxID=2740835 RepID=A0A8X6KDW8_TRICU|nr:hypothetical protein TNCT_527941 [Trichonephila clavata]
MSLPAFDEAESAIGCHCLPSFALDVVVCRSFYLPAVLTSLHVDASLQGPGSISFAYTSHPDPPLPRVTLQATRSPLPRLLFIQLDPRFHTYPSGNCIPASTPTLLATGSPLPHTLQACLIAITARISRPC